MKRKLTIIFSLLLALGLRAQDNKVVVEQTEAFSEAFSQHIIKNPERKITGYRIRIYFDNDRNARQISENIAERFTAEYPDIPIYRNYVSPFFKVTVGDFRTRDEAAAFAETIKGSFPSTFLVKEAINYPAL